MKIKVIEGNYKPNYKNIRIIYLVLDNWNDYSFYTLYEMYYVDDKYSVHKIGPIKIGYFGQNTGPSERKLKRGTYMDELNDNYFSLGQSDSYYYKLNNLGANTRDEILYTLKDIAYNKELFEKSKNEEVTRISLFRSVSPSTVESQFRRLLSGGAKLTEYYFNYKAPKINSYASSSFNLSFKVIPNSFPPTNLHVLIGRNGVGKTHLINNMIDSLLSNDAIKNGNFEFIEEEQENHKFANVVYISFSAFDTIKQRTNEVLNSSLLKYSYIGIKKFENNKTMNFKTKDLESLTNDFLNSLKYCRKFKRKIWKDGIGILESDPNFREAQILSLVDIENDKHFENQVTSTFKRLSSGHKIVLLTITGLIEILQEKSLVILDEPESHLHPPLLSAFIRALSNLLILTNGVAVVATHSPVILQEVPKSCVWKLRRIGAEAISERLKIETFGQSVGILTNEIFGLEVTNSGFYTLLNEIAKNKNSYDEVLEHFKGQLGMEARAILMTYFD